MRRLKKILKRKTDGSILNVLSGVLVILAAVIIAVSWLYIVELAEYRTEIRQIARGYTLKMETLGCLTPELRTMLLQDLAEAGLQNVDLSGTSVSPVGYGKDVILKISGTVYGNTLDTDSGELLSFVFSRSTWQMDIRLQSTAKY